MNLIDVMERFPDQESCIEHLEQIRWQGTPKCPHCESEHVRRRNERETGRIGRYNCHGCRSTFKVTHGTIFQNTKPLFKNGFSLSRSWRMLRKAYPVANSHVISDCYRKHVGVL